ncbi:autolysin [Enterococcus gallinarum]|uniref:ArpU family phage packaging/lysis transcriptional regulator n=1 Tax=Enterococcus casseliflavus TaxID=37734 RepID=UPI00076B0942|nr:ArpU family phage packaging/lysis transcriptional regulator [Enterococcus casseliflavus]AMG50610.1 autolysin [Enterococcus gallinarum]GEB28447.1 hypothetical protein ECA02_15420 [Enterococcus casseliflavus]STP35090.1 phage transcriptional regulator, ArpU family [Enterococcus casseliflavus]
MTLLPEIDENKTRANARKLLMTYRRKKRRLVGASIDPYSLIRSPEITDDPAHRSNTNGTENVVIQQLRSVGVVENYSKEIVMIDQAIASLSDISQKILRYSYCDPNKITIREIAYKLDVYQVTPEGKFERVLYSEKNIERLRAIALYEFADVYSGGILIAQK